MYRLSYVVDADLVKAARHFVVLYSHFFHISSLFARAGQFGATVSARVILAYLTKIRRIVL